MCCAAAFHLMRYGCHRSCHPHTTHATGLHRNTARDEFKREEHTCFIRNIHRRLRHPVCKFVNARTGIGAGD